MATSRMIRESSLPAGSHGVVPRITVELLNNGRIGRIAVKMRIITVESRRIGRIAVELIWLATRVMRRSD